MNKLQSIVKRLSEKPFNRAIRAVDFDEKSPDEQLQILNDVLGSLDANLQANVRAVQRDDVVDQMLQFLLLHKCDCIPSNGSEDGRLFAFVEGLRSGQKDVIYPILHWVLSEYESLEKRTYLSQYLMPVDVPTEYLMQGNGNLEELFEAYKELQAEFIEVHRHGEAIQESGCRPASDVIDDVKQLEVEERQLHERLQREQAQTRHNPNFQHLLAESSKLRQAQDDEIRLEDQMHEQKHQLLVAKRRLNQTRHMLEITRSCQDKPTIDDILRELEHESKKALDHLETNVLTKRHKIELMLLQAEKEAADAEKTEDDAEYMIEQMAQLEEMLSRKQLVLDTTRYNNVGSNLDKLAPLRQEVTEAAEQLHAKKANTHRRRLEKELLSSTNTEIRESIYTLNNGNESSQRSDGTTVDRREMIRIQDELKHQLEVYDNSQQEIAKLREDISKLKSTEAELKDQHNAILEQYHEDEEKAGVVGFRYVNEQLEQTSKQTVSLNELKSQTLDEISIMVQQIAHTLEGKKQELEPKIEELKQKRSEFKELQERHGIEKERYDTVAAKLINENKDLERECERLQQTWTEKEKSYRLLCTKDEMGTSKPGNTQLQMKEQQTMAKQTAEYASNQRALFANLKKLLELKAQVTCP